MSKWIAWDGGPCPIKSDHTKFSVIYRDNECESCFSGYANLTYRWNHMQVCSDIVAYKITESHEPEDVTQSIHLSILFGHANCDDCGFYEFGNISSTLGKHEYCTHMGPSLPTPIEELGSPYDSSSYMQGYAQALADLGYTVTSDITNIGDN